MRAWRYTPTISPGGPYLTEAAPNDPKPHHATGRSPAPVNRSHIRHVVTARVWRRVDGALMSRAGAAIEHSAREVAGRVRERPVSEDESLHVQRFGAPRSFVRDRRGVVVARPLVLVEPTSRLARRGPGFVPGCGLARIWPERLQGALSSAVARRLRPSESPDAVWAGPSRLRAIRGRRADGCRSVPAVRRASRGVMRVTTAVGPIARPTRSSGVRPGRVGPRTLCALCAVRPAIDEIGGVW
jgi:hypothetical protein